jgi:sialate O-acetylesterase
MFTLFKVPCAILTALLVLPSAAFATITLPDLISDGAVLQRDHEIPVWGKAPANTDVFVTLGEVTRSVKTNSSGEWRVVFPARGAGGPLTLAVAGGQYSQQVKDIYIGDVWIASGQSNMEFALRNADNADAEMAADDLPQIRHLKVPLTWSVAPATELAGGQWQPATGAYKGEFSAVGYFFAKKIHGETGIPIGVIGSNWGGSNIEAWMSPEALGKTLQQTQSAIEQLVAESKEKTNVVKETLQRWPGALVEPMDPKLIELARSDWSSATLNTDDWLDIDGTSVWESQGFPGMDGVVWYRKTFTLSEQEAAGALKLSLGRIDDNDITWINGHEVGATKGYDLPRHYIVPAKHLNAGVNTIAIRVEDTGGGGGIYSPPESLYLQTVAGNNQPLVNNWKIKADKVALSPIGNMHHTDSALYNKMIHPLYAIPVKGVIWYQGESNANTVAAANHYPQQFQALINDWRQGWQQPELPFYWVQLANFNSRRNSEAGIPWAILREAQTAALVLPQTGHAITIDVGEPDDIHPRNKKAVGERLALSALYQTYGLKNTHYRGPVFTSVKARKNQLVVKFNTAKSLAVRDKEKWVKGFEVVTADGTVTAVDGKLKGSSVVIQAKNVDKVTGVRYAWDDNPAHANLQDSAGLPAEPFRAKVN